MSHPPATARFIDLGLAERIRERFGTPVYVYDQALLEATAAAVAAFPSAFGLLPRYAMKACPTAAVLRLFDAAGLWFDASSGHEARRAMAAGIVPGHISLSSQELPADFAELHRAGVEINACSPSQLDRFGDAFPGGTVGLRFNPGTGSGGNNRTNVGGPSSSFGIWHAWIDEVRALLGRHRLRALRIHTHIGSGSAPEVWQRVAELSLGIVRAFPDVVSLNLGGGFKVARMPGEVGADLQDCGAPVAQLFREFAAGTGRELRLEIEPGTYLVANAGALLASVQDVVSTGEQGYRFIKLDSGMTELLRPSMYGSQHPITLLRSGPPQQFHDYVVAGHCCESGDILTPAPGDPELLAPRRLPEAVIGDLCVIDGAGAYAAGMSAKNYNSYPEAPEVLIGTDGEPRLIRRRQDPAAIWANEVLPDGP